MSRETTPLAGLLRSFITDGTPEEIVERYESLPARAAAQDFGPFDSNVVVLDTETTGFSLAHDELTQIAAARVEKGQIVDWFVTFVNPGKPIPDDVAHLTDIHDEDVADAPSASEALAELASFVGDAIVVAHNAEFDRNFTTKHPTGYPLLENLWVDSLDLSRIALPRMKSHRLIDLVKAFGAPRSTHRADEDVAATCALLRILLAGVEAMPAMLLREISQMATAEEWPTVEVFKYFAERAASEEKPLPFSLRALRRERVGKMDFRPLVDADDIAADPARSLVFPTAEAIAEAFTAQGMVGSLYADYEQRDEQVAMAEAVRNAFARSRNLMVEAGTGVGKSMAYLVPAAITARDNKINVGVATKTNALLDQLVYHELPALNQALGANLTFASLKGFSHYPCLRRIERIVVDGPTMLTVGRDQNHQAPALAALLSFIEQTAYDDMDNLKIDYRVLPRRAITTTSHDCLRRKCPFFGTSCFVHGSRRKAEAANIVVTNHSLLFCDLAADGGLLPPVRYWVVDEAHSAENEARRAFSRELSEEDILSLVRRVASDESRRNVFVRAERTVVVPGNESSTTLFYGLTAKARSAGKAFGTAAEAFCASLSDLLFYDTNRRSKGYETVDLWLNAEIRAGSTFQNVARLARAMAAEAEKMVTTCQELVGYLEDIEGAAVIQREIASIAMELKEIIQNVEVICVQCPDRYVYAATLNRKNDRNQNKLEALLFNVGQTLNETLYANTHSVVYASATLAVDGGFKSFAAAMGLGESEFSPCDELQLDSSYDFDRQMTVYVVSDMPEPNEPSYLTVLQRLLVATHRAQKGSMLTLFTNRREMEKCFEEVQPALKADQLRLVCQKWGVSVKGLRDDFLADEHLSLFALKSFWEGFDAPGATLKGVIIPKLPFAKPSDPLSCERAARDDAAWRRYVLPAAVIETKQAAGRLIRKADDRGVLILADKRLVTKGYGKTFLRSLPSQNIRFATIDEIVGELTAVS
ncbi:helicase C-terminal domain-containing protein [uncultured Adlercreutzia sp.]|uniref:helicase C-terminal domain-containing protein n=1 Tax=uncultured Adlercreutzia sp. TaxID=875803 RepID=UPI0025DC67A2|nr:helicase C-terminal domain-containing protein [uncultured Adlercreutzia sp.]